MFIDGERMLSSGCENAFGSRCTETTFETVLGSGSHMVAVDVEFADADGSKKVLAQLSWEHLGTGDCEWRDTGWGSDSWLDISGIGQLWGPQIGAAIDVLGDDDYFTAPLPFSFPFYGGTKRSVRINANGYITFS